MFSALLIFLRSFLFILTSPSNITIEEIIQNAIDRDIKFPIIKSDNFGHIEKKIVIPIGVNARINTKKEIPIEIAENCIE